MLIKVCGMREKDQILNVEKIADFVGFIFFDKSERFVRETPIIEHAKKVGVFVNASLDEITRQIQIHSLDTVQLHGNETPELCAQIDPEISLIKAFGIEERFNFGDTRSYEDVVDFFLFDTKTPLHGGSGQQYDWSILSNYTGSVPFFLSGGIGPNSLEALQQFRHPQFAGIDLNSGFERSAADKDISLLEQFIEQLKN